MWDVPTVLTLEGSLFFHVLCFLSFAMETVTNMFILSTYFESMVLHGINTSIYYIVGYEMMISISNNWSNHIILVCDIALS